MANESEAVVARNGANVCKPFHCDGASLRSERMVSGRSGFSVEIYIEIVEGGRNFTLRTRLQAAGDEQSVH